jgi:hypothetical protein
MYCRVAAIGNVLVVLLDLSPGLFRDATATRLGLVVALFDTAIFVHAKELIAIDH